MNKTQLTDLAKTRLEIIERESQDCYDLLMVSAAQKKTIEKMKAQNTELIAALECLAYTVEELVSGKSQTVKDALTIARAAISKAQG